MSDFGFIVVLPDDGPWAPFQFSCLMCGERDHEFQHGCLVCIACGHTLPWKDSMRIALKDGPVTWVTIQVPNLRQT